MWAHQVKWELQSYVLEFLSTVVQPSQGYNISGNIPTCTRCEQSWSWESDFVITENNGASEDGGESTEDDSASVVDSCTIPEEDNSDMKQKQMDQESVPSWSPVNTHTYT